MLDIIIIIFIGLIGVLAAKKGFIKTAYQMVAYIVALVISFMVYPMMSFVLKLTPIYEGIKNWNISNISAMPIVGGLQAQNNVIREVTKWLPEFMTNEMIQNNNPEIYALMNVNNVVEYISTYIADLCINAMAVVFVWIAVRIALGIFIRALDLFTKLPLLNLANKVAGFGLGIAKGTLIVWMSYLLIPFLVIFPAFNEIQSKLGQSILAKWLYDNNLILDYLNQIFF